MRLAQVFIGALQELPPEGQQTGLFKQPVVTPCWVGPEGIRGDHQADRRVHGGPEKAVHQMSLATYARMRARFPHLHEQLRPGSLGENLSVVGLDDESLCIGDQFQIGEVILEISQPRRPCWKINHRFGEPALAQALRDSQATGWYYRVLNPGWLKAGDAVQRLARPHPGFTLSTLWSLKNAATPCRQALLTWAELPTLNADWRRSLRQRHDSLAQQATDAP